VKEYSLQRYSVPTPQLKQRPRIEDSESGSGSALSDRFEHEAREEHEEGKDFFRFDALAIRDLRGENISAQVLRPDE
jgi:hypothetical protein